jgi:CBS domain-containing protein
MSNEQHVYGPADPESTCVVVGQNGEGLAFQNGMRVQEIMSTKVATIESNQPADVAWSRMNRHRIRHLVALDGSDLAGIVSERDLGGRSGADVRRGRAVEDLMTSSVVSVEPAKA